MRLSPSFVLDEFACHDGTDVPAQYHANVTDLCIGVLQPIRDQWGALIVVSGYRTPEWNLRVAGAKSSTHLTASGADIRPVRIGEVGELAVLVETMFKRGDLKALGGVGVYRNWIHVDIKRAADGHLRRWFGHGVGSEPGE